MKKQGEAVSPGYLNKAQTQPPKLLSKKDCDAAIAGLGEEGKGAKISVYDGLALLLNLAEDSTRS